MKRMVYFLLVLSLLCGTALTQSRVDAQQTWPYPIPCRVKDGTNKDLFVMMLGDVKPAIADGIYDPMKDEVRLKNGKVIQNYYRDSLRVRYYKPIDKSIFPLPPSGWCSWYFYYQDISEKEVKLNARWIADNLKDYGAKYVQIDDGWQGETAEGRHGSRDWTTIDKAFPGGMDSLASYIKSLGLKPGIWLAPHGQSNEYVVKKNPGVFLLKPDSTSASSSWEGAFLVDPSVPETQTYLKNLFTTLASKWGYEYFKIDGQPTVVSEFRRGAPFMKNPSDDIDGLYRKTLESIRTAIGPNRYLLGCWGIPLQGIGIMNGSRTGGDVVIGWDGFGTALSTTMQYYYLHNIAWYTDPDVMLLRSPMTLDQARVWAALQGLTGQALMANDRLMDLSAERVELLRSVYPAVDIRPLDLFPVRGTKRIWDLKINHLNRNYDVVGVFNFDQGKPEQIYLSWRDLGLPVTVQPVHVFDFWNKEYLGAWEAGMVVDVAPTACRVLTLMPSTELIQLVSTSRHITQGWVDLVTQSYNPITYIYTGKSKVIKNDPYELRFAFPRGKNFAVKNASARTASGTVPVKIANHQFWAAVQFVSPQTTEITWEVVFTPADFYHYNIQAPSGVRTERVGFDGVNLRWGAQYYLNGGYQVFLNGELLGYTPQNSFPIRGLNPNIEYTVGVGTVWEDGTASSRRVESRFTIKTMLPAEMYLSDLVPVQTVTGMRGRGGVGITTPSIGGKRFEHIMNTRTNSESEYDLKGIFSAFSVSMGIDDAGTNEQASVEFVVIGDGKELWRSGALKKSDGVKQVQVTVTSVQRLILRVTDASGGTGRFSADWVDAKVIK